MTDSAIATAFLALHRYPSHQRWLLADTALLLHHTSQKPFERGRWGQRLYRLIQFASALGCTTPVLYVLCFGQLCWLHLRYRLSATPSGKPHPHLFVGFGAGAEAELLKHFSAKFDDSVTHLDETQPASFAEFGSVGFWPHWQQLANSLVDAKQVLSKLPAFLQTARLDLLCHCAKHATPYAYYRLWFQRYRQAAAQPGSQLAFLTPWLPAFAATDAGLSCSYLQHGLNYYLLLPDFASITALTREEANWFKRILPRCNVQLAQHKTGFTTETLTQRIVILSIYGAPDYLALIKPFLVWCNTTQQQVSVRPHPRERHQFWTALDASIDIDTTADSFDLMLARLRPRLVVSWYSTTLAEALQQDLLPLTICPLHDSNVNAMVYPLFKRALQWPRDQAIAQRAMHDGAYYKQVVQSLQQDQELPTP